MSWLGRVDLKGAFVMLSASFPVASRAHEGFPPARPDDIADATTAVVRGVLAAGGRLVFGGHPTITPLVLLVASEMAEYGRLTAREGPDGPPVVVYQSELYEHQITRETRVLQERGYGRIEPVQAAPGETVENNTKSLELLRTRMFEQTPPVAAFFVGGMAGVPREHEIATSILGPAFMTFPLSAPGGSAATLEPSIDLAPDVAALLGSRSYSAAVQAALSAIR